MKENNNSPAASTCSCTASPAQRPFRPCLVLVLHGVNALALVTRVAPRESSQQTEPTTRMGDPTTPICAPHRKDHRNYHGRAHTGPGTHRHTGTHAGAGSRRLVDEAITDLQAPSGGGTERTPRTAAWRCCRAHTCRKCHKYQMCKMCHYRAGRWGAGPR